MTLLAASLVAVASATVAWTLWSRFADHPADADAGTVALPRRASPNAWLGRALQEAGVDRSPAAVLVAVVTAAFGVFGLVTAATRTPLVAVAPTIAVVAALPTVLGHRRRVRRRATLAAWPDALRELVATLTAGRSLGQALAQLGETGPESLRAVFADFPALVRVFGTVGALGTVQSRLADPTSDRVIEVLLVAHEHGGAIVREILEDLVVATTADLEVLTEIDTEGLEQRINGRAVLVLPWLVLVALTLRPGPFRDFYASTGGSLVIAAAAACSVVGAGWLGRLGTEPPEPRVFGAPGPGDREVR